jgi:hypothetical protein
MSKMVLTSDDELSVKISPIDKIKNMCTHKYPGTSQVALIEDAGNPEHVTCRVCGESFNLISNPDQRIQESTDNLIDILQSIKTMYLDIPEDFAKEYFQVISLIKKVPQVWTKGYKNINMYDYNNNPVAVGNNMNSFSQVNSMIGGYNMGGIQPNFAPMYYNNGVPVNGYYPQQQYAQQPVVQNTDPNVNPFYQQPVAQPVAQPQQQYAQQPVYQQPVAQPVPQAPAIAPAPGVNPAAPAPVPTVQNPVTQTGDVNQTKAFTV